MSYSLSHIQFLLCVVSIIDNDYISLHFLEDTTIPILQTDAV